jgi:hypothetical protein
VNEADFLQMESNIPAVTFVTFASFHSARRYRIAVPPQIIFMENLIFYLIVQLNLIFGVAGLLWPEKLMPVFGLLMFPWLASHRAIRTHGFVAIIGYLLVLGKILISTR